MYFLFLFTSYEDNEYFWRNKNPSDAWTVAYSMFFLMLKATRQQNLQADLSEQKLLDIYIRWAQQLGDFLFVQQPETNLVMSFLDRYLFYLFSNVASSLRLMSWENVEVARFSVASSWYKNVHSAASSHGVNFECAKPRLHHSHVVKTSSNTQPAIRNKKSPIIYNI